MALTYVGYQPPKGSPQKEITQQTRKAAKKSDLSNPKGKMDPTT